MPTQVLKPHITKHPKGWKCRRGWMQVVMPTAQQAYARWIELTQTHWSPSAQ